MTALAIEATVDAYPLGRPPCGTLRYGMTPEQQILYRWLVKNKPHSEKFRLNSRVIGKLFLTCHSHIHDRANALVERGWLRNDEGLFSFVEPIQFYAERRNAA